jgi:hypothetical protein
MTVAVVIFAVTAAFGIQLVTSSLHAFSTATRPARIIVPTDAPQDFAIDPDEQDEDADGDIDLIGNAVDPAVAEYSVDALGSQYEVHSPQTELPRLGSPKT